MSQGSDCFVEALWSQRVEGSDFRSLVIQSDRVFVSTDEETLVLSGGGELLDRDDPPRATRQWSPSPAWLNGHRSELKEGQLVESDSRGSQTSSRWIAIDPFARHRDRFSQFPPEWIDRHVSGWWRTAVLLGDGPRGRLLAFALSIPPWLVSLRTDGRVDWVLLSGSPTDCCNEVTIVSEDGTLAHLSSCGKRITFVSVDGQIVSVHEIEPMVTGLATNRRGVAWVTLLSQGVAAYQPVVGRVGAYAIPNVWRVDVEDGVLYAVIKDSAKSFILKTFKEPI